MLSKLAPRIVYVPPVRRRQFIGDLFSSAIAESPIKTTVVTGAVVGAISGGLTGVTLGALIGRSLVWHGAAAGAALLGLRGYASGRELSTWLKEQT